MIRIWVRRCTPRRGRATWCDAAAQRCTISTTPSSATQQRPRRQRSRQSGSKKGQIKDNGVSNKTSRRASPSSDTETDWSLWKDPPVPVEEQEARFERCTDGRYRTFIIAPCPACGMQHSLNLCPFVFEYNPWRFGKPKTETLMFNGQMDNSQKFHDAVVYMRRKFVHRMPNGDLVYVPRSETKDAPPLARLWLSNFDSRVTFHKGRTQGEESVFDAYNYRIPPRSYFPGHYPTTDHDGRPFLIVYTNSGHFDDWMPYEIELIRSFVTEYNRGIESITERSPDVDTRPIGVVMVTGRWHVSRSYLSAMRPTLTVGIASEYSWFHGYSRWGFHIGAKNNNIKHGYSWWSVAGPTELPGARSQQGGRYMNGQADTASAFTRTNEAWLASIANALLRDVRDPAEHMWDEEGAIQNWPRILLWRRMLLHRAATFYGTDSSQYRGLYAQARSNYGKEAAEVVDTGVSPMDILPRWRHIHSRMSMAGKPYEEQVIWRSVFQRKTLAEELCHNLSGK
ncbi:hypothetical protein FJTKL_01741 [Diaporthe vaccinii]|uniref:Uncharacterized protein n=1 Tax=Diaporthe vaccinii TaxID=105482 RepID=A0ABR4F4L0_9PEZI